MRPGLEITVCTRCGRAAFPERQLCPGCGFDETRRERVDGGVVEEATILRRAPGGVTGAVRLGSVRLDAGPLVVARLAPGASAGMRVRLLEDDGVPVAEPWRAGGGGPATGEDAG